MSEAKPLDLEGILKECVYEWNEKAEKYIQKQFKHWIDCYYPQVMIPKNKQDVVIVPISIKHDFWRDVFTDVVETVKWRMCKLIKQRIKSACEFFLKYKDKPELLWEEAEVLEETKLSKREKKSLFNMLYLIREPRKREDILELLRHYNEWLFKLAFKGVLK